MEKNKGIKAKVMSILASDLRSNLTAEELKWIDSNLPNDESLGNNYTPEPRVGHWFDGFTGFDGSIRGETSEEGTRLMVPGDIARDIMDKMRAEAENVDEDQPTTEVTMVNLLKNLTVDEMAFIAVNGIGSMMEHLQEAEKEFAWRKFRKENRGKGPSDL